MELRKGTGAEPGREATRLSLLPLAAQNFGRHFPSFVPHSRNYGGQAGRISFQHRTQG